MPVRSASVWRQISERADKKSVELAVGEGRIGEQSDDRGLQRQAHAHFRHHVLFALEVEIGLDGRGAKHHVEAAGPDFRHIAGHDRIAAFRHRRRLGEPPFGAHAEGEKADAERLGDNAASGEMALELGGGQMRVVERRARELELSSRFERDRAFAMRVIEADQGALVLDALPAEMGPHALQERPDAPFAAIRHGSMIGAIEGDLFVLRANPERALGLASRLEPGHERIARLNNFTIDDVASH